MTLKHHKKQIMQATNNKSKQQNQTSNKKPKINNKKTKINNKEKKQRIIKLTTTKTNYKFKLQKISKT